MRKYFIEITLLVLLALLSPIVAVAQQTSERLFNGQDLSGWHGDPNVWSVEDRAITGRNTAEAPIKHNTYLIWQGDPLKDFELHLQYRIVDGNSGVQYRSKVLDAEQWIVGGYQADIEAGDDYSGILYDERGRGVLALRGETVSIDKDGNRCKVRFQDAAELQNEIRAEQWNDYRIVARGELLQHWINDKLMSETRDAEVGKRAAEGVLALQVHSGPPMVVQFRKLRLTRFDTPEPAETSSSKTTPASMATPVAAISAPTGFQVELVYSVPRESEGSWVALAPLPAGELLASDQHGRLYRILPSRPAAGGDQTVVEPVNVPLGNAQGLLWAHDSLYVVVNSGQKDFAQRNGLYRIQDTNGDGHLDTGARLQAINGEGEHGPHAVIQSADGKHLYVLCGNHTAPIDFDRSRVPPVWDEDQLLPRMWDAHGHAAGILAPGGWIARTDPDGQLWECVSIGYRNPYDIAVHSSDELFTYDADMEWDIGAPWYRPTRVCHATSGSDFGWRSGTGKWPESYPDSLPGVIDLGPGSPTGITFGYGAKFPAQYQQALFVADWSFGKLYAIHLAPSGATFRGTREEFVTGAPLPLTDVVVHPDDGAMYFAIGGRRTQSALYRVRYVGEQSTAPVASDESNEPAKIRRHLARFHGRADTEALDAAWPLLDHPDRFLRYAARVAVESQPVATWQQRTLAERRPQALLEAMVALARHADSHDQHLPRAMFEALGTIDWGHLSHQQKVSLLRVYGLIAIRLGPLDKATQISMAERIATWYPAEEVELNQELSRLLIHLNAPGVVEQTLTLLDEALSQEEQIHYALALRTIIAKATPTEQQRYFAWFRTTNDMHGGHSLRAFLENVKNDAAQSLTDQQREGLADLLRPNEQTEAPASTARPVVKEYRTEEIAHLIESSRTAADLQRGRRLFAEAQCAKCHRVGNEGGATGPDLTTLARRFSARDIAEAIVEPSKVISDRFRAIVVELDSGQILTGRIANLSGDSFNMVTDMLAPGDMTTVERAEVISIEPSPVSVMPANLLDTFEKEEVRDLLAFVTHHRTSPEPPPGFMALFNGHDLEGWHGLGHFDPRQLKSMSDAERAAKREEDLKNLRAHWSVENGELVNDGHGVYLTTNREFADIELLLEYKTVAGADSGVYLRNTPQVQIWDFTKAGGKWDLGAGKGSGGLWNNSPGAPGKDPLLLADRPFGQWNQMRILQVGARTSVWLNDKLVVDHATMENFWDRARPLFRKGQIQLQTHGGEIRWRNIFIREIPPVEANEILSLYHSEGFEPIFNGRDLSNWTGATAGYEVADGALRCKPGNGKCLFTEEVYDDFSARLEFNIPSGGNNGLAIRYPGQGDPAFDGMCELQILDNSHNDYRDIDARQYHGSAYGMVAAQRGYLRPAGEWNFQQVTVRGTTVRVELNGFVILDADLAEVDEYLGNRPHPGKMLSSGHFGLAGHNDAVEFRNIRIKRL